MALRILYKGSPVLESLSKTVEIGLDTFELVDKLKEAIRFKDKVWTLTGLSICAVQIGIPLRVVIIGRPLYWNCQRHHQAFDVLINPELTFKSQEILEEWEGCLSLPDIECLVPRHSEVRIKYQDLSGKTQQKLMKKTLSRVIQHEIDHLNGKFMTELAKDSRPKMNHLEHKDT